MKLKSNLGLILISKIKLQEINFCWLSKLSIKVASYYYLEHFLRRGLSIKASQSCILALFSSFLPPFTGLCH